MWRARGAASAGSLHRRPGGPRTSAKAHGPVQVHHKSSQSKVPFYRGFHQNLGDGVALHTAEQTLIHMPTGLFCCLCARISSSAASPPSPTAPHPRLHSAPCLSLPTLPPSWAEQGRDHLTHPALQTPPCPPDRRTLRSLSVRSALLGFGCGRCKVITFPS